MEEFMSFDFIVTEIHPYYVYMTELCDTPMLNRQSYSLSLNTNGHDMMNFHGIGPLESAPGDITFLPAGSSYDITVSEPYDNYCVSFRLTKEVPLHPFVLHAQNNPKLMQRFIACYHIQKEHRVGFESRLRAELYSIFYEMKKQHFNDYMPQERIKQIQPAIKYIREHSCNGDISVLKLAELCNMSPEYLRQIFKGIYGLSPLRYANTQQMNTAKELLRSNCYSISQVAKELGYDDISQFSHKFKTIVGVSPMEYVKHRKP